MGRFDLRTRTGLVYNIIQGNIAVDNDFLVFFNRVISAGGTLSVLEQIATNKLVIDLKSYDLWNSMKAIYPMVGSSSEACSQNLISSSFTGSFSSGWTFTSTGVTPNGTSAYLNSNFNQSSNLIPSNNHISVYSKTDSNALYIDCGVTNNTSYSFSQLFIRNNGNTVYENGSQVISAATSNSLGFYCGTSTSNTSAKLYKNGSSISSSTTLQARTMFNNNIYIAATNFSNIPVGYSNRKYAFVSIGYGLTDTQAANFYTAVQAFQTTLSRQV